MTKKLKLKTNMDNQQLENYLSKALRGLQAYKEPDRKFPDKLANQLKQESTDQFKHVMDHMIEEITDVIKSGQ